MLYPRSLILRPLRPICSSVPSLRQRPEIAGSINTNCAIEWISLEDFRSQLRIVPVSLREKSAANDDFADIARRNKRTRLILYADFHPIDWTASDDTRLGKTRRGEDLGRDSSALCRRIAMSDAPIAFEMPGKSNNVLCVEPLARRPDETERRKPKIVG